MTWCSAKLTPISSVTYAPCKLHRPFIISNRFFGLILSIKYAVVKDQSCLIYNSIDTYLPPQGCMRLIASNMQTPHKPTQRQCRWFKWPQANWEKARKKNSSFQNVERQARSLWSSLSLFLPSYFSNPDKEVMHLSISIHSNPGNVDTSTLPCRSPLAGLPLYCRPESQQSSCLLCM